MSTCTACFVTVPDSATHCSNCGNSLGQAHPAVSESTEAVTKASPSSLEQPQGEMTGAARADRTEIERIEKKALQRLDVARSLVGGVNRVFLFFSISLRP
jgi:hypothetical protein